MLVSEEVEKIVKDIEKLRIQGATAVAEETFRGVRLFLEGYDDTGKTPLIEEHYVKGEEDGTWKTFFPSGKVRQQLGFKLGKRQGMTAVWNEKGDNLAEENYTDGKVDGTATRYLPDGKKIVQIYKDGKFVSETKE